MNENAVPKEKRLESAREVNPDWPDHVVVRLAVKFAREGDIRPVSF